MNEQRHTKEFLKEMQALPLNRKIQITIARITEWYQYYNGEVYISFSGGKDSTVLLDIARKMFPDIEAVFVDTGLEYPEIKEFIKTFDKVTILRPKMNFKDVIIKYGYPFIGKEVAESVSQCKKYLANMGGICIEQLNLESKFPARTKRLLKSNHGGYFDNSRYNYSKYAPLLTANFGISHYCCNIMKKLPLKQIKKKPIIGTMATESSLREQKWLKQGCNAFDNKKPISQPMSFWTEQDVLEYIKVFNLPIAQVYGVLEETGKQGNACFVGCGTQLRFSGCQRTGCVFCGFGSHLDTRCGGVGRFVRLKQSHPKLYNYCMNGGEFNEKGIWQPNNKGLGMKYVIDELNKLYSKTLKSGKVKKFIEY